MIPIARTADEVKKWLIERGYRIDAIDVDGVGLDVESPAQGQATPALRAPRVPADAPVERAERHAWVDLREHVDICWKCGTGKENSQNGKVWITTWHLPDGTSRVLPRTPPCKPGPRTEAYLRKHAVTIAAAKAEKKGTKA